ncbi:MAG: hypothetical protein KIT27_11350 [Legionellales bacterium]|nr:hypothetical protein [Legionellales bacterium]
MKEWIILTVGVGLSCVFVLLYVFLDNQPAPHLKQCDLYVQANRAWCGHTLEFNLIHPQHQEHLGQLYIPPTHPESAYFTVKKPCEDFTHSTLQAKLQDEDTVWLSSTLTIQHDRVDLHFPQDFNAPEHPAIAAEICQSP